MSDTLLFTAEIHDKTPYDGDCEGVMVVMPYGKRIMTNLLAETDGGPVPVEIHIEGTGDRLQALSSPSTNDSGYPLPVTADEARAAERVIQRRSERKAWLNEIRNLLARGETVDVCLFAKREFIREIRLTGLLGDFIQPHHEDFPDGFDNDDGVCGHYWISSYDSVPTQKRVDSKLSRLFTALNAGRRDTTLRLCREIADMVGADE